MIGSSSAGQVVVCVGVRVLTAVPVNEYAAPKRHVVSELYGIRTQKNFLFLWNPKARCHVYISPRHLPHPNLIIQHLCKTNILPSATRYASDLFSYSVTLCF
jgi:hypothetical protein